MSSSKKEITIRGQAVSPGYAVAKATVYRKTKPVIRPASIESTNIDKQKKRFREAREIVEMELKRMMKREVDQEALDIIDAQIEMVNDPELHSRIESLIENDLYAADYAIYRAFDSYLDLLSSADFELIKERTVDVADIRDRLIQITTNHSVDLEIDPGTIVIAKEVGPREVIQLAESGIEGLVMDRGGTTSHASIIARAMNISSIVGTQRAAKMIEDGDPVIIDGNEGVIIVHPSKETITRYKEKVADRDQEEKRIQQIIQQPSATRDGKPFVLRANIEFLEELPNIEKYNALGIGLLRTESLYIRKDHFEDHSKQESFYGRIMEETDDLPVTIRLFDAGGDKFFSLGSRENNPFLGWRGIRMLLDEQDLLYDQMTALLRTAGRYPGRIKILVPMVTNLDEVLAVKETMKEIQERMREEGEPVDEQIQLGIMIEVPSVALQASEFASLVDFFSIGSNDLTQYTLAVDRSNELISEMYRQNHPAVWRLIKFSVDAAKEAKIDISVCGEMAADPDCASCLLGLGISELSMSPVNIPAVKKRLREHEQSEFESLAEQVLQAGTAGEVSSIFSKWKQRENDG